MVLSSRLFMGSFLMLAAGGALTTAALTAVAANPLELLDGAITTSGGYLIAGESGATYRVNGSMVIRLAPGTELKIAPQSQFLSLAGMGLTRASTAVLRSGRLWLELGGNKPREALLVTTPGQLSVIARAGAAYVASERDHLVVAHGDGEAWARKGAVWEAIPVGEIRNYASLDEPPTIGHMLRAPRFSVPRMVLFSTGSPVEIPGLGWAVVPGARDYELESSGDSPTRRHWAKLPKLPPEFTASPGTTRIRVRALDEQGVPGMWSTPTTIRVVSIGIPAGAETRGPGIVELGEGQLLSFEHAEGLLLSYRGLPKSVPATLPVGLHDGQRTVISLFQPGAKVPAVVTLEPRSIYAVVEAGPKTAVWPRDPIHLRVALRRRGDGAQGDPPVGIQAIPSVTLDTHPLEVAWHHDGNEMSATIPPQTGRGRCVVRVEVHDQHGLPLGRDYVEIVEASSPTAKPPAPGRPRTTSSSSSRRTSPPSSR